MLNREIREWIQKIERGQYSYEDAMQEFARLSAYMTKEEIEWLKSRLIESYKS